MPIGRSAKKSLRKSVKNRKFNLAFKNRLKEVIKKFLAKPEKKGFSEVQAILDKAEKRHLFSKNKVARLKAKYAKKMTKDLEKSVIKKSAKGKSASGGKVTKKTAKRKTAKK